MAPPNMLLQAVTAFLSLSTVSASPFVKGALAPPSKDDFYSLPKGYEKASPGDILRHRKPPGPLAAFGDIPLNLDSSYQVQFRTTNSQGKPDTDVTTILIPKSANNSRLISYQDFEDSSAVDCTTSYALHEGKKFNTGLSKSDVLFEAGLLNQGYCVNLPDYEGRKAAFGSGRQAGYATLDSIRAVLKSSKFTGIAKHDVDITMWGYAGGSIPTEWAAEMQPDYAPELKILAAAVGGIIGNINNTIHIINDTHTPHAGFGPAGLIGLHKAYESKEFTELLHQETFSENRTEFMSPLHLCAAEVLDKFSNKNIISYFRSGAGLLDKPLVKDVVEKAGIMGKHSVPQIPMFFYHAVQDEVMPIKGNDELIDVYCNKNINSPQYIRHKVGNHAATSFAGAGGVNAFLKDCYCGVPAPKGCHKSDVMLSDLDQKNLAGFGDTIVGLLGSLTAAPLGIIWIRRSMERRIKSRIRLQDFLELEMTRRRMVMGRRKVMIWDQRSRTSLKDGGKYPMDSEEVQWIIPNVRLQLLSTAKSDDWPVTLRISLSHDSIFLPVPLTASQKTFNPANIFSHTPKHPPIIAKQSLQIPIRVSHPELLPISPTCRIPR